MLLEATDNIRKNTAAFGIQTLARIEVRESIVPVIVLFERCDLLLAEEEEEDGRGLF